MPSHVLDRAARATSAAISLCVWGMLAVLAAGEARGVQPSSYLEVDTRSDYSHIRVYRRGSVRSLVFVRDSGEEAQESLVDLDRPYELHFQYLQYMFASYLFQPKPEKVLIVGVGGGSMIHFLERYDPQVEIEAVEIDPTVVDMAQKYFRVRNGGKVNLVIADAVKYLERTESQYDVIYMDAFLKPSRDTDGTGAPVRLRTTDFYQTVQKKLKPSGLVVFNLNPHQGLDNDLAVLRKSFPQIYVFRLPTQQGLVVVASAARKRVTPADLTSKADQLDRRLRTSFSFRTMVKHLER